MIPPKQLSSLHCHIISKPVTLNEYQSNPPPQKKNPNKQTNKSKLPSCQ